MLQGFLDPDVVAKQVFSNTPNPKDFMNFIYPSQLEVTYGGTAPKCEKFWPPCMPPITEELDEKFNQCIPRKDYIKFVNKNPSLVVMPKEMRKDLKPLKSEIVKQVLPRNE